MPKNLRDRNFVGSDNCDDDSCEQKWVVKIPVKKSWKYVEIKSLIYTPKLTSIQSNAFKFTSQWAAHLIAEIHSGKVIRLVKHGTR